MAPLIPVALQTSPNCVPLISYLYFLLENVVGVFSFIFPTVFGWMDLLVKVVLRHWWLRSERWKYSLFPFQLADFFVLGSHHVIGRTDLLPACNDIRRGGCCLILKSGLLPVLLTFSVWSQLLLLLLPTSRRPSAIFDLESSESRELEGTRLRLPVNCCQKVSHAFWLI